MPPLSLSPEERAVLRELLHDEPREPADTVRALAIAVAHANHRPEAVRAARRNGYSWGKLAEATGMAVSTLRGLAVQ